VLSRVHWVRPELVAEVKFLTRSADNLLRQVVYEGLRPRSSSAQRLSLIEAGATMPPSQ
jgi:ATP-dependent DNA ligase